MVYLDWVESKANDYIGLHLNLLETDIPTKELCVTKRFILFVDLFTPSFNWSPQEADIFENKFFFATKIQFFACVANFPLHLLRVAGRRVLMESVFSMEVDCKAQLCLMISAIAY